jgi:hypothetical protein
MLNRKSFEIGKFFCPAKVLLKTSIIFGHEKGLHKIMFDFYLREYQLEIYGLQLYRKSKCDTKSDLLDILMDLQVKHSGSLALEFKCLGKLISKLADWSKPSKWEVEPEFFKFKLTESQSIWHISLSLQTYDFTCRKTHTLTQIINVVKREIEARDIDVVYGAFKDGILQNILDIFNDMNKESVTIDSFNKFKRNVDLKYKPSKWHQDQIGMKRKTYYKLVNFLESLSPKSWVCSALDKRRLQKRKGLNKIRERVLERAPDMAKPLWQLEFDKCRKYAVEMCSRRRRALDIKNACETWRGDAVFTRVLRPFKKRINRLPLIEKELTLFSLLRLVKKRPCPVSPFALMIKFSGRVNVEAWSKLMLEIRESKFFISDHLKEESIRLNKERNQESLEIRKRELRAKQSKEKRARKELIEKDIKQKNLLAIKKREEEEAAKIQEEEKLASVKAEEFKKFQEKLSIVNEREKKRIAELRQSVRKKMQGGSSSAAPIQEQSKSSMDSFFRDTSSSLKQKPKTVEPELPKLKETISGMRKEMVGEIRAMVGINSDMESELRESFLTRFLERFDLNTRDAAKEALEKMIGNSFKDVFERRLSALTRQRKRELKGE